MPELDFYEKRKISEIDPESDSKVKVLGLVLEKKGDTLVIDDGSGKLGVFGNPNDKIKSNKLVRVFGQVLAGDTGFEMRADIVQDLSGLDINLYKTIDELYKKKGV